MSRNNRAQSANAGLGNLAEVIASVHCPDSLPEVSPT